MNPDYVARRQVRFLHAPPMDDEPDRRAGTASKAASPSRGGDRDLRHPPRMRIRSHGIGHHTVTHWRTHDTTRTTAPAPTGSVPGNTLGRESNATSSTSSGPTPTGRKPGRCVRNTLRSTSRASGARSDMESEPDRRAGSAWKAVRPARDGLRLLRSPPCPLSVLASTSLFQGEAAGSKPVGGTTLSGGVIGNTAGSGPVVRGSNPRWTAHINHSEVVQW